MTALEICRAANPAADEEWADYILWSRTPFPCGKVTPRDLYRAASAQTRADAQGLRLCDMCEAIAAPGDWTCRKCEAALRRTAPEAHKEAI